MKYSPKDQILDKKFRSKFNYSFDVRGKPLQQARHWSAPEIFGSRAKFNTNTDLATLDIEVRALISF